MDTHPVTKFRKKLEKRDKTDLVAVAGILSEKGSGVTARGS